MLGENTLAIFRKIQGASDGFGGFDETVINYLMARCRLEKYKSNETIYNGRNAVVADFVIYCDIPNGYDITEDLEVVVNSHIYDISFVENCGGMNSYLKIYLRTK